MRKTWKRVLSTVLAAAMVVTGASIAPGNSTKTAKADDTVATPSIAADIYYADYGWDYQGSGESTMITGDGTYTVTFENPSEKADAVVPDCGVFVVDMHNLNRVVKDLDAIKITDIKVTKDGEEVGDASKYATGNLEEENDNYRINIFNQYYTPSKEDPAFDSEDFSWKDEVSVTFTISGLNGNYNNRWANAGIYYADYSWSYEGNGIPVAITGDGDYTVTFTNPSEKADAVVPDCGVFVVDLKDMNAKVKDYNNIKITDIKVTKDGEEVGDASKYATGNLEEENDNYRINIFNQYYTPSKEDPAFDSEDFSWKDEVTVSFHIEGIEWGEPAPAASPSVAPSAAPSLAPGASFNAYLCFQTDVYAFRNDWADDNYGLKSKDLDYKTEIGYSGGAKKTKATIQDAVIDHNGEYTLSISDIDLTKLLDADNPVAPKQYNAIYVSTDIPRGMDNLKFSNVSLTIDGSKTVEYKKDLPLKGDLAAKTYYYPMLINDAGWNKVVTEYKSSDIGIATKSIEVKFTVSGFDSGFKQETVGPAKGKTFTSGNFKYKVTTAATQTTTSDKVTTTTGKVALAGLSAKGKKAKSLTLPATVKSGKAEYTVATLNASAFKGAKATKITLNKNIKKLPKNAFANCKKLSKITFKAKLSSVNKAAFKGCKKTIKVAGTSAKANLKKLKKTSYKKFK